jgi:tetratricopeptide (TPR) repeat protein
MRISDIHWGRRANGQRVVARGVSSDEAPVNPEEDAGRSEIDGIMERGVAALEGERYDVATELFRRVIQRAPFRLDARNYLAVALDRQFARGENGQAGSRRAGAAVDVASSATAATSGRARATRVRFPVWLAVASLVVTAAAVGGVAGVVSYLRRHNVREWVDKIGKPKPPPVEPAVEQIAADLKKADAALAREQFDEALGILTKTRELAASLNPPNPAPVENKMAEVYSAKAAAFYSKENYDKALEAAQDGLKFNDTSVALDYLVGRCYERKAMHAFSNNDKPQGRRFCEQACEALEKTVRADPGHLPALDLLGKTYSKFNEIKAIETWRQIVKQAPDTPEGKTARNYLQFRQIQ